MVDLLLSPTLFLVGGIALAFYLGFHFGKKTAWWEINIATLSEGDWIRTNQRITCYGGNGVGRIDLPEGTIGQIFGINGRQRIALDLHQPISVKGQTIEKVWDISDYDKFLIVLDPEQPKDAKETAKRSQRHKIRQPAHAVPNA